MLILSGTAQDDTKWWTQEHVFAIPFLTEPKHPPHVSITTSFTTPVFTSLTIAGAGYEVNSTITKDTYADITLSIDDVGFDIRMRRGDDKQNKTIIVRSSADVVVHAIDNDKGDGDGFVVTPTKYLGTQYYVASFEPSTAFSITSVCISALYSNTIIYIETENEQVCYGGILQYETIRFERKFDLSGTLVNSDKPIAVISGLSTKLPQTFRNPGGLIEQVVPTKFWGNSYIVVPFPSKTSGYVYRVFTKNITGPTTLHMSMNIDIEIQTDYFEDSVIGSTTISFKSDHPVMVVQYLKGEFVNNHPMGGPSMLIVPPVSSFGNNVTFTVFQYMQNHSYFVTVIAECSTFNNLSLDGEVTTWNIQPTTEQTMRYASLEVSTGLHTVSHPNPSATFYVSVAAICNGCQSSYAYSASAYFGQSKYHLLLIEMKI